MDRLGDVGEVRQPFQDDDPAGDELVLSIAGRVIGAQTVEIG